MPAPWSYKFLLLTQEMPLDATGLCVTSADGTDWTEVRKACAEVRQAIGERDVTGGGRGAVCLPGMGVDPDDGEIKPVQHSVKKENKCPGKASQGVGWSLTEVVFFSFISGWRCVQGRPNMT